MKRQRWLQIAGEVLVEAGYPADHVAATLKVLTDRQSHDGKRLLSTSELSDLLGISRTTMWRLRLPSMMVGRCKRYDVETVLRHLAMRESTLPHNRKEDHM